MGDAGRRRGREEKREEEKERRWKNRRKVLEGRTERGREVGRRSKGWERDRMGRREDGKSRTEGGNE